MLTRLIAVLLLLTSLAHAQILGVGYRSVFTPTTPSDNMPTAGSLGEFYPGGTVGSVPCSSGGMAVTTLTDNLSSSTTFTNQAGTLDCFTGGANSQPYVSFTGAQYMTANNAIPCMTSCSVYMVVRIGYDGYANPIFGSSSSTTALSYQINNGAQELNQQYTSQIGASPADTEVNTWYELAFVYYEGTVTFYLNGVATSTGSAAATITSGINWLAAAGPGTGPPPADIGQFDLGEIYFSNVGTYQPAVHTVLVSRFAI